MNSPHDRFARVSLVIILVLLGAILVFAGVAAALMS